MVASCVCLNSMDQNPYESPTECRTIARRECGTNASLPRSTLGGVIRLLCIVIGLFVAFALCDAFVVSVITSH